MIKYAIRFWPFTTLDYKFAEKYLEEKAQKGLLLSGLDVNSMPIVWYKKTQPLNVKYCIDGFKHSPYNEESEKKYSEYLEMAKKSGWNHVCEINYMQYFVSDVNSNPVPLHTQEETEFEAIKIPYRKFEMPLTLICLFVMIFMNHVTDGEIIEKVMQGFSMLTLLFAGSIILLIGLIRYIFFLLRGSKAITKKEVGSNTKNTVAKIWGSFYNAVGLFQLGMISLLFPYILIFKDYQKTGSLFALYCGVTLFVSLSLMKISDTAESIDKEREHLWRKIGIIALCVFVITFILTCILVL